MTSQSPSPEKTPPQRGSILEVLRRAPRYLRVYWFEYLVVVAATLLAQSFSVSLTVSPKLIVDEAITPQNGGRLVAILVGLGGMFIASTLLNLAADYTIGRAEDELKKDLRFELFKTLQYIPARFFTHAQPGEVVSLFARELIVFRDALRTLIPNGFSAVFQLVLTVSALIALDVRLSIAVALSLPFVIFIPRAALGWAAESDFRSKTGDARIAAAVQDNVQSQAVVRAFGLQEAEIARFRTLLGRGTPPRRGWEGLRDEFSKGFKRSYFQSRLVGTLTNVQYVLLDGVVLVIGGYLAYQQTLTPATLLTFFPLLAKAGDAVTKLTTFFRDLISAASSLERLDQLSKEAIFPEEFPEAVSLDGIVKTITFDEVLFSHDRDRVILNGINCTIPAGGATALVGRSGTGKSTLLHLLIRLYDPTGGQIQVDGHDLRELTRASLHQQIGVMLQDAVLFNTSVRANIAMTRPQATDAEIEAAAREAEIHEDISRLPQGYDTVVGEGGKLLSPGQRQRVSLARALIRKPSLLVLDEPTAALDPETESAVVATLQHLAQTHTLLIVTHRLSSVANFARQIIVLDQGKVTESGSHEELLAQKGLYARFWGLQSGFTVSGDGRMAEVSPDRLRAIPLFAKLDLSMLHQIAGQFTASNYEADQVIFHQGDPGARFYIIVRGKVSIQFTGFDGKIIELDVLQDGDYFGEIALLQDSPRGATVKALLPTLTLSLERSQFMNLIEENTEVRLEIEESTIRRNLSHAARQGRGRSKLSVLDDLVDE